MAYVIEGHSKYDPPDAPLPVFVEFIEPDTLRIAESQMRMDRAAREYWQAYKHGGIEHAIAVAQGILTHDELESEEFSHILWKRHP